MSEVAVIRPFLKWAGGKTRVVPHLRRALDPLDAERLVEPFVGSGAVFLNLPRFRKLLLADANGDLIDLYRAVAYDWDAFMAEVRPLFVPQNNARAAYLALREEFNASPAGSIARAARFVYLNRHGFNGLCRYNARGGFNVPFGRYAKPALPEAALQAFHARIQTAESVRIEHADFRDVFASMLEEGDVVYADPPYVPLSATASFTAYAARAFGDAQQRALVEASRAAASRGVAVVISNHDVARVRELYAGAELASFPVARTISCAGGSRAPVKEVTAVFPVRSTTAPPSLLP